MLSEYDMRLLRLEQMHERTDRLARTGIPKRFWHKTWDDFEEREDTEHLRKQVMDYAERFGPGIPGLLLQGPPGVGKTMALCLLGVQLVDAGFYVRFMPLAEYLDALVRQIKLEKSWQSYENFDAHEEWKERDEELRRLREVAQLVIFDDVGKEHHTSSMYAKDTLDSFMRYRWNVERPTAITTNIAVPEWGDKYGAAMRSFVHEACEIISVDADDWRPRLRRQRRR